MAGEVFVGINEEFTRGIPHEETKDTKGKSERERTLPACRVRHPAEPIRTPHPARGAPHISLGPGGLWSVVTGHRFFGSVSSGNSCLLFEWSGSLAGSQCDDRHLADVLSPFVLQSWYHTEQMSGSGGISRSHTPGTGGAEIFLYLKIRPRGHLRPFQPFLSIQSPPGPRIQRQTNQATAMERITDTMTSEGWCAPSAMLDQATSPAAAMAKIPAAGLA